MTKCCDHSVKLRNIKIIHSFQTKMCGISRELNLRDLVRYKHLATLGPGNIG